MSNVVFTPNGKFSAKIILDDGFDVVGDSTLDGMLTIDGIANILDKLNADAGLEVTGATTLNTGLEVTGLATMNTGLNVTGNIGVGTASPTQRLEVIGNIRSAGVAPRLYLFTNTDVSYNRITFGHGTTTAMTLRAGMPGTPQPNWLDLFIGEAEAGADQIFSIRPDEVVFYRDVTINNDLESRNNIIRNSTYATGQSATLTFQHGTDNIRYSRIESNLPGGNDAILRFYTMNNNTVDVLNLTLSDGDASIPGNLNTGTNCYLGNYSTAGFACFRNRNTSSLQDDYALIQDASGRTILNSTVGQVLQFRQGNSSHMTINAGNVGIGTETPSAKLHVIGTVVSGLASNNLTAGATLGSLHFHQGGNSVRAGIRALNDAGGDNNANLCFYTSFDFSTIMAERMRINRGGNVGINTTNPTSRLHVVGNALFTDGLTRMVDNRFSFAPEDIPENTTTFGFGSYNNNGNNAPYADVIHLNNWSTGGGDPSALMINRGGFGIRQWKGTYGSATNYSSYSDCVMADSSNNVSTPLNFTNSIVFTSNNIIVKSFSIGIGAGTSETNVAIGIFALNTAGNGGLNVAIGSSALRNKTSGIGNVGIGNDSLFSLSSGSSNVAIGRMACRSATTGGNNVGVGHEAMFTISSGINNVGIGYGALYSVNTGNNNIGIGWNAGRENVSPFAVEDGDNNIVMGNNSHQGAYIKIGWAVTSDARDKSLIGNVPLGLEFVNKLKPKQFQFLTGNRGEAQRKPDGINRYGFMAQDILELEGDAPVIINNKDHKNLKYTETNLIPVLVNAIQELTERVRMLENKLMQL